MPDFMKEDCENESGGRVYRQVEKVDGYLDSTIRGCDTFLCKDLLKERRNQYIEVYADRANLHDLVPGPGYYRFTLQQEGDPRCVLFERFLQKTYRRRLPENAGICIASEQIEKPISRYETTIKSHPRNTSEGEYINTTWQVLVRKTDEVIFKYTKFNLRQNNFNRTLIGCEPKVGNIGPIEFLIGPKQTLVKE